jgi:hypothetical protein
VRACLVLQGSRWNLEVCGKKAKGKCGKGWQEGRGGEEERRRGGEDEKVRS